MYIWNNVHTKITARLILQSKKRFFQYRPVKNVNTHRRQITARLLRFLFKFFNMPLFIGHNNAKAAGFFPRYRHTCDGYIRFSGFMEIQHDFIIHLINMVSSENQYIFRIIAFNILQILENSIRCSRIPVCILTALIWWQERNAAIIPIQIPRDTNSNMCIQP